MVDCSPSWAYRPTFTSSATPCVLPGYDEQRARLYAGGTIFRSHGAGTDKNNIEIEVIQIVDDFTLTVYKGGMLVETFGPYTQVDNTVPPPDCTTNVIDLLRPDINLNSSYIEMPPVDYGYAEAGTPFVDAECMSPFPRAFLSGGSGGPSDDSGLLAIRTGHDRTMFAIKSTEIFANDSTDDGQSSYPPSNRRVSQWNGTAWVEYNPASICP